MICSRTVDPRPRKQPPAGSFGDRQFQRDMPRVERDYMEDTLSGNGTKNRKLVQGKAINVVDFGAFVQLPDGLAGLIR